jgi:hypothetical protein
MRTRPQWTRPQTSIEHVTINYSDVLGSNRLQYNTALGVLSSHGNTQDLETFLALIRLGKKDHLNTNLGGTLSVQKVDALLPVYRTGDPGRYWTTTPPSSPWQHALEMSMPSSIYPASMKLMPNFHPANKRVLIYQLSAGEIVASGLCAPLDGFPGMGTQIYIPHVPKDRIRAASWSQWQANGHLSPASTVWNGNHTVWLWSTIENERVQGVVNNVATCALENFSSVRNDMAIQNVAPRALKVVSEYAGIQTATSAAMKNLSFAETPQSVKIYDVCRAAPASSTSHKIPYQKPSTLAGVVPPETSPMNWRPGISVGRSAPWYQAVNYPAVARLALNVAAPPLMTLDAYHRMEVDRQQFPGSSERAHGAAVAADMAVDFGLYAGLARFAPAGAALPVLALGNITCGIANGMRNTSPESMMDNRDLFEVVMNYYEFSPRIEQEFFDDFDKGGTRSRGLNRIAAEQTKTAFKPFEWGYDIKKSVSNAARALTDLLDIDWLSANELDRSRESDQLVSFPSQQSEIVEISSGIDGYFDELASDPIDFFNYVDAELSDLGSASSIAGSINVKFLENKDNKMLFNISMGTSVMTPDFHGFLFDMSRSPIGSAEESVKINVEPEADISEIKIESKYEISPVDHKYVYKPNEKPAVPFLSDIRIGKVGDKIGVVTTVAGAASVGVAAGKDGFLVAVTAEFGGKFWAGLGAGLGVGAVVAGVLLTAKYFYSKHQKHIAHKINAGIKHTNEEGQLTNEKLQNLYSQLKESEQTISVPSLIKQTESLMTYVQGRIDKEESRAHYAKKHESKESKNAHRATSETYKSINYDLFSLHKSLKFEEAQSDFIKAHSQMTANEIATLAKNLITKFSTKEEAAVVSEKEKKQSDVSANINRYHNEGYKF